MTLEATSHLRARQSQWDTNTFVIEQCWVDLDTGEEQWEALPRVAHDGTPMAKVPV